MFYALIALTSFFSLIGLYLLWLVIKAALTASRVKKYMPPLGEFVEIQGNKFHFLDRGDGPPIIMIHGLSGQIRHYTYAMQHRLDNEFRTVIVDRPGAGHSERSNDNDARITRQANFIADFIKKKGLEKPLIVGHSLGGAVSLALALNHPQLVGGLALIAPLTQSTDENTPVPDVFRGLAIRSSWMRWFISWTFAIPTIIKNSQAAMKAVFDPEEVVKDMPTRGGGLLGLRPIAFYNSSTDMVYSIIDMPKISQRYGELKMPVGIMYGDQDQILSFKKQGLPMKDVIPQLELDVIEGGGHMLPMTQPDKVATFIRKMATQTFATTEESKQTKVVQ